MSFWESVLILRKIDTVATWITIAVPVVSALVMFTVRHRMRTLETQHSTQMTLSHDAEVRRLAEANRELHASLKHSGKEITSLKKIIEPRILTQSQADVILKRLEGVTPLPVVVAAYGFDEESAGYGEQIAAVLKDADWPVTYTKSSLNDFKGVSVNMVSVVPPQSPALYALVEAFTAARFDLRRFEVRTDSIADPIKDGSLIVVVGRK